MSDRLQRLADLIVLYGANVQPGQIVAVHCQLGQEELTRALADSAYRHGAKFVDAPYFDPYVKRARIAHAAEDTLSFVPSWMSERALQLGEQRCARIALSGPLAPGLLDDLDPSRTARDQLPYQKEIPQLVNDRTTNWTGAPCPNPAWAKLVHPELGEAEALEQLWQEVEHVMRLDEPDAAAAWDERMATLNRSAQTMSDRSFDAIHLEGPGTDLTVGLFPSASWWAADFETVDGIKHRPNLPTEEVFTCPDPVRTEGHVTATKPLVLRDGTIIRGLEMRFEGGRAVEATADEGQEVIRGMLSLDDGAARLGELALVDREGRIGPLGTVFYDTLLDENAASHIAIGNGFGFVLGDEDAKRMNRSQIHIDFMIGSNDLDATGITRDGERVPVLRDGSWQI